MPLTPPGQLKWKCPGMGSQWEKKNGQHCWSVEEKWNAELLAVIGKKMPGVIGECEEKCKALLVSGNKNDLPHWNGKGKTALIHRYWCLLSAAINLLFLFSLCSAVFPFPFEFCFIQYQLNLQLEPILFIFFNIFYFSIFHFFLIIFTLSFEALLTLFLCV